MHLKRTLIIKTVTKNKMNIMVSNDEGSKQIITQLAKYIQRFFDYANDGKKNAQKRRPDLGFFGPASAARCEIHLEGPRDVWNFRHRLSLPHNTRCTGARAPSGGRHGDGEAVGDVRAIGRRDNSLTFPRRRPLAWRQKLQFGESG